MRDFRFIPRCSPRPEFHEELDDVRVRTMKHAARLIAFGHTEEQAIAVLEGNGVPSADAFLAVKAAGVLNG